MSARKKARGDADEDDDDMKALFPEARTNHGCIQATLVLTLATCIFF